MHRKQLLIGSILCLVASASWGAMFPVAHRILLVMDPLFFSLIRYLAVAAILTVLLALKEGRASFRLEGKGKSLLFLGTMGFTVYNMGVFLGQQQLGEAGIVTASIMEVLMPMLTILVLWLATREAPDAFTLTSVGIALAGAALVISNGNLAVFITAGRSLVPVLFILAGVIGWVIYSIGGSRFEDWSILRYSTFTCLLGSAVNFVIVTLASGFHFVPVPIMHTIVSIRYELSFMILLPGLAALLCWNAGIKLLTPVNGLLFINFVPITTFLLMALQGYAISIYEFFGTMLIIFALIRNNARQRRTRREPVRLAHPTVRET